MLASVGTEAKNRMVTRVEALRGQQGRGQEGPSNKGQVNSLKDRLQLGGQSEQGIPGRSEPSRWWCQESRSVCFPVILNHSTTPRKLQKQAVLKQWVAGALRTPREMTGDKT